MSSPSPTSALDEKIRAAFHAEEADLLASADEQPLSEQVLATFRGRSRWLVGIVWTAVTVWSVVLFTCGYQFYLATEPKAVVGWGVGVLFAVVAISMLKIWYWMELNRNAVTREVKRVELLLATLVSERDSNAGE
ncbi:DUF6768 family protein [Stratiformator vulcanicus]|uniref:Uncharacterized protein n=1 Tax=Stratiformator vulcanicus TaxID=2527980 RepID=A0A517R2L9_9PLAN|nr:DUF6768 family protein [Stratiformator vulcanicus]QDT38108.1 hypothetical protein Pan189_24980 [Stratiformator vulcanicus]